MERIFASLPAVLDGMAADKLAHEAMVKSAWVEAAGELLSERTNAESFEDGRLYVTVEDKTWQRHLEDLAPQLIAKLNSAVGQGTVRFVEFRIGPRPVRNSARKTANKIKRATLSPGLVDAANKISDETLRKNFLELASIYLAGRDR